MDLLQLILIFALINSCIEIEISAPSFPDIMSYFKVPEEVVGLTITYNLIGLCIASLIYGPLSGRFGRRRIMILGNLILVIGSVGCVVASDINLLLIFRFIQGLGAATSAVLSSAIIADRYKTKEASKIYGVMNAIFSILMAISPVIGGIINEAFGWRANYFIVAAICIISFCLITFWLPETLKVKEAANIKKVIKSYYQLLTSLEFMISASVPSVLYGCYLAFVSVAPFIYMNLLELSITTYTLHQAIIVVVFAIFSIVSSRLIHRLGEKLVLYVALAIGSGGFLLMLFAREEYLLTTSMSLISAGDALIYPIIFTRSMEIFPNMKGITSSAIMCLRYLICSTITAAAIYLYDGAILDFALLLSAIMLLTFSYLIILLKKGFITPS